MRADTYVHRMLELIIILAIFLSGFALGYGARAMVSRRHHADAHRRRDQNPL
jgi:hypothetical protein